jgi:dihydroorotate dehydrogenase (fumarate)
MAGANVTMMASKMLGNGIESAGRVLRDVQAWMEQNEYESVRQMMGSMSQKHVKEPSAFERANYMKALHSWKPDPTGRPHF